MIRIFVLAFVWLALLSNKLVAQECFDYYKTNCKSESSRFPYQENASSVSFLFSSGESREIPFNMYAGKDYRFLVCASTCFADVIKIRIINSDEKIIYDNSQNSFALNVEFSCKLSQETIIEISAPQPAIGVSDTIYEEGCIGILIEEMISVKTGF